VPEFVINGIYTPKQCIFAEVLDANMLQIALKTPAGLMKFSVNIHGLHITKLNLVPEFNYVDAIKELMQYSDLIVDIKQINNKYGILEGQIYVDGVDLKNILLNIYIPYLIQGIPFTINYKKPKKNTKLKKKKVIIEDNGHGVGLLLDELTSESEWEDIKNDDLP
jgi:hypothetical protein